MPRREQITQDEALKLLQRPKRSKYGNRKVVVDGITFDSQREADRWGVLRLLEASGAIQDLKRQVRHSIIINGQEICDYISDFEYVRDGRLIVEDAKGFKTAVYRIKKRLLRACCGIEIQEV